MKKDTSDTWDFKALHCPERRKYFKNLWKKWSMKKGIPLLNPKTTQEKNNN